MELVLLNLECLWDARITGIGKETWPALHRMFGSSSHRTLSPVLVGSASKLIYVSVDESRHGLLRCG